MKTRDLRTEKVRKIQRTVNRRMSVKIEDYHLKERKINIEDNAWREMTDKDRGP